MSMQDFQRRVVDEREELNVKIVKLAMFLHTNTYGSLPVAEQVRLENQRNVMVVYRDILDARITAATEC
jgi:hypothetical protein